MSKGKIVLPIVSLLLVGGLIMFWSSRGYGKVSPDAYEVSKALYGACLAKNDSRLDSVEELCEEGTEHGLEITDTERRWLKSMVDTARKGDWKSAAQSARQMMEDQVEH
jgi:hypothetical protein